MITIGGTIPNLKKDHALVSTVVDKLNLKYRNKI
jgi:hypothetical protein